MGKNGVVKEKRNTSSQRLSVFIHQHRKKIVDEWVEFARTLKPWAKGLSRKDLQDHAEELLDAIVSDMKSSQTSHQQSEKSKGRDRGGTLSRVGKKHAIDRLEGGLKLDQLVSEYRALRASVLRLWEETKSDKNGGMTRFNEAIDETLAESAVWYTEQMSQTREHFLDILGHDLRDPLNSIIVGATILTKSESIDVKQVGVATRILNSAGRLNRMVNDLLDLTRTRLGVGIPVMPKPTNLIPMCQQAVAELEAIYPDCQLRFEARGDLHGEWDSDRLTQVVSNLVANAMQYGCDDGPVSVVAQAHGDEVVLRVHNEGPPISEAAMKKIFEPMVRQPTPNGDKHTTGLGLGLYIAREIVTAHGGTIAVASAEEGTTFTVQIPRRLPKKRPPT
ncbi:MAG: HAMP domain-containing sensor histidine kinase [Gemmatimonadaceae bacterium]